MKNALWGLPLATLLLFAVSTIAADKVVVIPLNRASSKSYPFLTEIILLYMDWYNTLGSNSAKKDRINLNG